MFGNKTVPAIDQAQIDTLVTQVSELAGVVGVLRGEKEALEFHSTLVAENEKLTKEKAAKELELVRLKEQNARETREIEHKVGLHQKQVTLEINAAKRETALDVREENLKAERTLFEEHMEFQRTRFEDEVQSQRKIMEQILDRLPKVTVERKYETVEHFGVSEQKGLPSGDE